MALDSSQSYADQPLTWWVSGQLFTLCWQFRCPPAPRQAWSLLVDLGSLAAPSPYPATPRQLPLRTLYQFPLAALTHTTTHTFSYSYAGQTSGMGLRGLNSKCPQSYFPLNSAEGLLPGLGFWLHHSELHFCEHICSDLDPSTSLF